MSSFDLAQARYDGATPAVRELTDELGTNCLGSYEQTDTDDAFECEERSVCYLCSGIVCKEHDDVGDCGGEVVHHACHKDGCGSAACWADRRDDYLLAQAGQ